VGSDPQGHLQVMHDDAHSPCRKFARVVERQLDAWDALYPDRRNDSPDNQEIRKALAEFLAAIR